jgi:DNA anti-recombination protein RmuC
MSASELSQELVRLNGAPGGPATTLETVLALGQNRSNGDLARALSLLDSLLRINTQEVTPWQAVARLLAIRFAEQRKLEEQVERLNTQLKDSQRDSQRKIDQLNEKLEALKAIERSLTVRPPAVATPPTKAP